MVRTLLVIGVTDHLLGRVAGNVFRLAGHILIVEVTRLGVDDVHAVKIAGFRGVLHQDFAGALIGELEVLLAQVAQQHAQVLA